MKLGFIKPTYPGEKRVALLPEHIEDFKNEIFVESGFGSFLDISDDEYRRKGCAILTREEIFRECDAIFSLKLIQEHDYPLLRKGQLIIGWTHPNGSGSKFFNGVAQDLGLTIADLDNIFPTVYYKDKKAPIDFIERDFIWRNSFLAGIASVQHALTHYGLMPNSDTRVAVLANGSVSQGAFSIMSKMGADLRMFYRKTMGEFYATIGDYDIIVNGIEVDGTVKHIITKEDLKRVKRGALIIDSAADAGNAVEGTNFTTMENPVREMDGVYFYCVNNAPSLFYRNASREISKSFSKWVYREDVRRFLDIIK